MKRFFYSLLIVVVLVAAASFLAKPVILFLAKKQIQNVFPASTVSIRDCDFQIFWQFRFFDVAIQKDKVYDFKAGEVSFQYSVTSILKRNILKVSLIDSSVNINLPKQSILEFTKYMRQGSPGIFSLKALELRNLQLNLKSKEAALDARITAGLNLAGPSMSMNFLDLKVRSLESQGVVLKDGTLTIDPQGFGDFYVQRIQADKVIVDEVKAKARIRGRNFYLDSLSGQVLNGTVKGELNLKLDKDPEYFIQLKFVHLDTERLVRDFDLKEKFEMKGILEGDVTLNGQGTNVHILSGSFSSTGNGGILVIKDTQSLERIARNSSQAMDIVIASFKNYHYNVGVIKLSLDQGNLVLDAALNGEAGKRNFKIILHDLILRGEKP